MINPDLDLPFVQIPFRVFTENVRQLLTEHNGSMPLARWELFFFAFCRHHRKPIFVVFPNAMRIDSNHWSIISMVCRWNTISPVGRIVFLFWGVHWAMLALLGIKDLQIVAGQGVIKKVQSVHSTTGTCLPNSSSSLDLSNSKHDQVDDQTHWPCLSDVF